MYNQENLNSKSNYPERNQYQNFNINDFKKIGRCIGKGQFSKVFKVENIKTKDIFAMKVIDKLPEGQSEEQEKQVKREINNLVKCYHWQKNYNTLKIFKFFETEEEYILILNYCDTNLEKYVNENYPNKKMPIDKIKLLFLELNNGFKNIYEEKVIHRDIKINNILIEYNLGDKEDITPRLGDFGISRDNYCDTDNPMTSNISWIYITSPEVLKTGNDYSYASDLWSIGILLYKLAFGVYPFNGPVAQTMETIIKGPYFLKKSNNEDFDDLIIKLLCKDKNKRINYQEYFDHPFFKFNEPSSIINFNKKYKLNLSSFNREFRTTGISTGNELLKDLSNVDFAKLKELNLEYCNISDIEPLTSNNFKNLVLLNLQYNNIYDLSPMKYIKFLEIKVIFLACNRISNIFALENIPFKNLKILNLKGNHSLIWDNETIRIYNSILSK